MKNTIFTLKRLLVMSLFLTLHLVVRSAVETKYPVYKPSKRSFIEYSETSYYSYQADYSFVDYTERKPFEEYFAETPLQFATFGSAPPFPEDPGNLPAGEGMEILIVFTVVFITLKYRAVKKQIEKI
ncbi:MAG: hypothetical protein LBS07_06520 [Prevotellaceae bacterium]|jgi:hypothetical protein|nr:hypothetical protein [Prevotellaceae bacterium]